MYLYLYLNMIYFKSTIHFNPTIRLKSTIRFNSTQFYSTIRSGVGARPPTHSQSPALRCGPVESNGIVKLNTYIYMTYI